ncbi:MAG: S1 RNA-binding domain-containing protein, partial [Enterococcus sp.]|nr:S1 RNA-binding domain-containing protein [Enterococcus sp.]
MSIEVGAKLQGKVSGSTNFGAFIDLGEGKTGLV